MNEIYKEIHLPADKQPSVIKATDIPPASFLRISNLSFEEYESIVNESSWEYIDDLLIHHSPESNSHNAILNSLNYRALKLLDPVLFIIRTSRIALSIGSDKPEPDLMIFDINDFRKKKRKDTSESEVIESAPLLIIEIVSKSSRVIDETKEEKYLTKGVKEFWRINLESEKIIIIVSSIKKGKYENTEYSQGEVRSRIIPDFFITFEDLTKPDISQ